MSDVEIKEYYRLLTQYEDEMLKRGEMFANPFAMINPTQERMEFLRSNVGPEKPTTPTKEST